MKKIIAVFAVLSITTIACTGNDENHQSNTPDIQSTTKESGAGETNSSISQVTRSSISQVTGLSVNASGPNEIKLKWDSVPNATTYYIYSGRDVKAIIPGTNYTDSARVRSATKYTYAIAAVVNGVLGPKSDSITVITPR